jgi:PAS domain S-box-containing protein
MPHWPGPIQTLLFYSVSERYNLSGGRPFQPGFGMVSDILVQDHPQAIWIVAAAGDRIITCNPAARRLLNAGDDRIAGLTPDQIGLLPDASGRARIGLPGDPGIEVELSDHGVDWHGEPARLLIARPLAAAHDDLLTAALTVGQFGVTAPSDATAQMDRRLESAIDGMPSPFFLIGRDLRLLFVNKAARLVLQEGRGREIDPIGQELWTVFPELQTELGADFDALLSGGPPVTTVVHLAEWQSSFRIDAFATPDGIAAHARNVTKRVQAERALSDSEERFRLAMQAARDVIFDWDIVNDRLTWSDAARERYGYDPAVFPGTAQGWLDRVHPDDRATMIAATEMTRQGKHGAAPRQHEYRLLRADGSVANVIGRSLVIHDATDRAVRLVGSLIDVTEIRHEDARLRGVVEVASDAIFEYDPARRMMIFTEGIRAVFGHTWVGEQPVPSPWREALHPEDRDRVLQEFRDFSRSTATRCRHEYRMRRGDGSYAHVREKIVALRDETGKGTWFIGSLDDVTLEREAEERLRQSDKIEAIGKLTGGVAHDFNNLLTVILGNAELLAERHGLDAEGRRMAGAILDAAERGAELTTGLLSFARKQPLAPRALDTGAVMAELRGLLSRTLPANVDLQIVVDADVWMVEADPSQMNAALLNLAVNARDAMPEGGKLTLECANARLDARYVATNPEASEGDFVRVSVSDTGAGMAPEVVARALEPFFTTKPPGAGSGIGLSMVHGFVRQSGGHLSLYSEPGVGTTVSLYLPRSTAAQAGPDDPAAPEALPLGAGQHVLVVEDNTALRRHAVDLVAGLGYRVSAAGDAAGALAIMRTAGDVDLLFTDVVMPGPMNGPALARAASAEFPGLRVLFTSGYTENAIIHHGRLDPGVQLLSKPYRRQDLAAKLRDVLTGPVAGSPQGG